LAGPAAAQCTLLADAASGRILVREGRCNSPATPASTFKIALSLMGFDSGVLQTRHAPVLQFRDGDVDWRENWRADTDPARWMKDSVVWYSQRTVGQLGRKRYATYVKNFGYGNRDLDGRPARKDGRRMEWINSSLHISPAEQLAFLSRLLNRQLKVSPAAIEQTAAILRQETQAAGWALYGKTGSGSALAAPGVYSPDRSVGWFVGWASKGAQTVVFVRMAEVGDEVKGPAGLHVRDTLLTELPALLEKSGIEQTQTNSTGR
jgi:beta-lactamase class D